ncbi:unnamed protein product, partial [Sphacelaria rigidula]
SRLGTARDNPRRNAELYVRAWMKEVWRAEWAEHRAARRPTRDFAQVPAAAVVKARKKRKAFVNRKRGKPLVADMNKSSTVLSSSVAMKDGGGAGRVVMNTVKDDCTYSRLIYCRNSCIQARCDTELTDQESVTRGSSGTAPVDNKVGATVDSTPNDGHVGAPKTALERILPSLPAARHELFLRVEAVSGLEQSFSSGGSAVSARIFWGGEEVGRTTDVIPPKPENPTTATNANSCAPVEGVLPPNNAHDGGDIAGKTAGDSTTGSLLDITGKVQEIAVASTSSLTKIAESVPGRSAGRPTGSVSWQHETFLLPFPVTPTLEEGGLENSRAGGSAESGHGLETNGMGKDAAGTGVEDDEDDSLDHLGDVQLRVEVWRGTHCLGQVQLEGLHLLSMCKKVQNAGVNNRGEVFNIGEGQDDQTRLPDHFPYFMANPEAFIPYKLPVIRRQGGSGKSGNAGEPPVLALTLLSLEPAQAIAAEGQLAEAVEILRGRRSYRRKAESGTFGREDSSRSDGIFSDIWPIANDSTGIAEALIRVLNAKRSPLTFLLQPLMLHVSLTDAGNNQLSIDVDVVLVLRSEVVHSTLPERGNDKAHTNGTPGNGAVERLSSQQKNTVAQSVIREQELGRSLPFRIRSECTVLSATIEIPPTALVEDLPRSRAGGERSIAEGGGDAAASGAAVKKRRIVAELVQERSFQDYDIDSGSIHALSMIKRALGAAVPGTSEKKKNQVVNVVARAYIEPEVLRRTVGSQRSIVLAAPAPPPPPPEGPSSETSKSGRQNVGSENREREKGGPENLGFFGRLEVAGHAVAARPARPCLRLDILECQNLAKADLIGKSDPCVLVYWDGKEVGRTSITPNDLNPIFYYPDNSFRLPLLPTPPSLSSTPLSPSSKKKKGSGSADSVTRDSSSRSRHRAIVWRKYIPELCIEVWDMDRATFSRQWTKGELLGAATLRGPCEIVPVRRA